MFFYGFSNCLAMPRFQKKLLGLMLGSISIVLLLFSMSSRLGGWMENSSQENSKLPQQILDARDVMTSSRGHKICILVPFRDRFDELLVFVPHLSNFLMDQNVDSTIYVLNQVDPFRFNRASLLNVGFLTAVRSENCDYVALHDVDLMPLNSNLRYLFPQDGPLHLSPPGLHPKYDYPNFIGGIMLISTDHFRKVNGMSNQYWGWGLEDDEFFVRLSEANLTIYRPQGIKSDSSNTFKHFHSVQKRKRDYQKCYNQRDRTRRRDRKTGLKNVEYDLKKSNDISIDGHAVKILNIWLNCDKSQTPWCDCTDAPKTEAPLKSIDPKNNIMPHLPKKKKKS